MTETKGIAPALRIANERKSFDERTNRRGARIEKANVAAIWCKTQRHLEHVHIAPDDLADGGELLTQFRAIKPNLG